MWWKILGLVLALLVSGGAYLHWSYRQATQDAETAWGSIMAAAAPSGQTFARSMVADQPEVVQRYFLHAIALGTPLHNVVELRMRGKFLLGDRKDHQQYDMSARQVLAPPRQFVWIPDLRSGPMRILGSDALVSESAWTRFWVNSLVPVVNSRSTADLVRSAKFRAVVEGIWAPAAMLPSQDIMWEAAGADIARLKVGHGQEQIVVDLVLDNNGAVKQILGLRWSDANPAKQFRLQPFGGTVEQEATFAGYTIPTLVKVGNHFGTADYLDFFQAEIVSATYH
jgi:hypothetical protein